MWAVWSSAAPLVGQGWFLQSPGLAASQVASSKTVGRAWSEPNHLRPVCDSRTFLAADVESTGVRACLGNRGVTVTCILKLFLFNFTTV